MSGTAVGEAVSRIHAAVDAAARVLEAQHRDRLRCRRGCTGCCSDDLTVFGVEAEQIRRHHAVLLAEGEPHPPGACAFLEEGTGACRIYAHRPYVCRTQGLPLRWIEEVLSEDGEGLDVYEYRDICPLNDAEGVEPPLEALAPEAMWTLGPIEAALAGLQPDGHREGLRELFRSR